MSPANLLVEQEQRPSPAATATMARSMSAKAALMMLRTYKVYVSPWFAGSCRYVPTCSVYASEAIERFGVLRGAWVGLKRLLRCHPLSRRFGYDPVPDKMEAAVPHAACIDQGVATRDTLNNEAHS